MLAIFSDKGRIGRAQFIAHVLGSALVLLVIFITCLVAQIVFIANPNQALLPVIAGTEALVWAWILLMSLGKRMKDADINPLWALAVFLGPLVIILPVVFAFYPGTSDNNRYGPQPGATS